MVEVGVGDGVRTRRSRGSRPVGVSNDGGGGNGADPSEGSAATGAGMSDIKTSCHPCSVL